MWNLIQVSGNQFNHFQLLLSLVVLKPNGVAIIEKRKINGVQLYINIIHNNLKINVTIRSFKPSNDDYLL